MRFLSLIASVALLTIFSIPARADTPSLYSLADCSISSLSGSSQSLIAANPQRKYLMVFNSGANNAYVNLAGGTAATSGASSVVLGVGSSVVISGTSISRSAVTVIGTAAQPVTCYEGR